MRFLLVNTNNAVRKIFNITAKKAAIQLDAVGSISQIPLKEDYNCIFIDDGVLNTGDISKFKNKMITTKFCIILSKDSPLVGGFDSYIRKPFLPTDIYEVMKKEKSNDMSISSSSYSADEGASVDTGVNANIDLNEFSDSEDEFLSGIKDSGQEINFDLDIPPARDDLGVDSAKSDFEIPATGGFVDNDFRDIDLDSSAESSAQNAESNAESNENTDDFEINFTLDDSELSGGDTKSSDSAELDIKATQDIDLDTKADISLDSTPKTTPKTAPKKVDILEEAEAQINNIKALADKGGNFFNSSNDTHDIDFSAVMALQDELLKEEESKNKKKLIGGDISRKKEPTKQEPKVAESSAKNAESSASIADKVEKKPNVEKDIKQDFAEFENKTDSALKDSAVEKELDSADIMSAFELDSAELEKALDSAPTDSAPEKEPIKEPAKDFAKESAQENIAPLDDDLQNFPHEQAPKAQASDSDFASGLDVDLDALDSISAFSDIQSDSTAQPQAPKNATEILNNLDITNLNEGFESPTVSDTAEFEGSKYNILGLPINDSGEIKDINDLSESELEKLDDEALLLLQERALQDKSPKVLNKAQIDAINDILEDTQSAGDFGANNFGASDFGTNNFATNNFSAQASGFGTPTSDFSMNNNEFQSLTQEALSEALDEGEIANFDTQNNQILEQDFGAQGFTKDYVADSFTQDFATDNFTQDFGNFQNEAPIAESSAQNFATQTPQSQQNIQSTPTKQISINDNLDLAEIIKTFPIDKLRELLSGVQITINITFPTKK